MDITDTTAPKSDQQNYDDVASSPRTVTITKVTAGSAEQPVEIHLAEFPGRPYKPSKSMRRVLIAAWGPEASAYVGRRITIYGDPSVKFGGIALGGIKISHLSDITERQSMMLTETRGKRKAHIVEPLTESASTQSVSRQSLQELGANFDPGVGDVATDKQMGRIGQLMGKLGMTESAQQLAYAGDVIERELKSANDLTTFEASRVITYLEKDLEKMENEE